MDVKKSIDSNLLQPMLLGLTLFFSLFFSALSWANNSIILPDSSFDIQITPYLSVLEDEKSLLTINDILSPEQQLNFIPTNSETLRFKLSDSSYWLRFSITNLHDEEQSLVFSISNNRLDSIDLYEYKSGHINHHKSGSIEPHKEKGGRRQAYPFLIDVNAKSVQTYFIRLKSTTAIDTIFRLQSDDQFLQSQQFDFTILGIVLGLVISSGGFFIFSWYFYRNPLAVVSFLYCTSIFFFMPSWLGQWTIWFPHDQSTSDNFSLITMMSSVVLQLLLVMQLKWEAPRAKLINTVFLALILINTAITLVLLFVPADAMIFMSKIFIAITNLIVALMLALFGNKFHQAQKFLLISHLIMALGIVVNLLTTHDFLAINFLHTWAGVLLPMVMVLGTLLFNLSFLNQFRQKRQQAFDSADDLLPRTLAKLGHEFRTPINGVMGMSELLADTHLTHTQRDYLETINLAGEDLLHLVSEMSDFSKLLSGNINLENRPFDLSNCLTQCMERYQPEASRKHIELVLDIADDISPRLLGDRNRLQTIINTLVAQSLRHTESGELELSVFHVGNHKRDGIFFQIQLTGSLIEHDELRRLFRTMGGPQEPLTDANIEQGIGLIIVKRLAALMQGSIEVETLTYQGCSITLFLPIEEEPMDDCEETEDDNLLCGKRILVVDDNATFRGVIEKQTKRWGMKADSTYSGKEALALMRNKANISEPYDFIIIDQDMPIMSGIQLTERLMADDDINPKPMRLMLTGLGMSNSAAEAEAAGIQKIVNKPISGRHLKEALRELPL